MSLFISFSFNVQVWARSKKEKKKNKTIRLLAFEQNSYKHCKHYSKTGNFSASDFQLSVPTTACCTFCILLVNHKSCCDKKDKNQTSNQHTVSLIHLQLFSITAKKKKNDAEAEASSVKTEAENERKVEFTVQYLRNHFANIHFVLSNSMFNWIICYQKKTREHINNYSFICVQKHSSVKFRHTFIPNYLQTIPSFSARFSLLHNR